MDKHADVQRRIRERLTELLARMPGVDFNVTEDPCIGGRLPDLGVDVVHGGRRYLLLIEVKTMASTRALVQAAHELEAAAKTVDGVDAVLGVLGVPHIGPALSGECRRLGLGYVDLSGNAHLAVGPLYVDISGVRSEPRTHALASVFAPKSSRIVRALLTLPDLGFTQAELAEMTGASLALVSRTEALLRDEGLVERDGSRVRATDPSALLDLWVDSYRRRRIAWEPWHVAHDDPVALARAISSSLNGPMLMGVFTGLLPASMRAPHVTGDVLHLYVDEGYEAALRDAGARPVAGAGALLVNSPPWDDGVFFAAEEREGIAMAHPVQVYLDLSRLRGRGEEAAAVYREHVLGY